VKSGSGGTRRGNSGYNKPMLPRIRPMRLRRIPEAFDDPDFLFELKHDGFRAVVYIEKGECRLVSRNSKDLRFDSLKKALAGLPVKDAILDGEIICLDRNGVSQFNQLLDRKTEPVLCAFDLLWLDGEDLRRLPLLDRKNRLYRLLQSGSGRVLYAQHIEHRGKEFFQEVCARDLEGIVAKRKLGVYKEDGNSWLKIKNPSYSQAKNRHELFQR